MVYCRTFREEWFRFRLFDLKLSLMDSVCLHVQYVVVG